MSGKLLKSEVNSNGGDVAILELIIRESLQNRGLAH